MDVLAELQLLGKIVLAALLAGLVGIEREFAEKPAGLRTHMLVGAGAALLVIIATKMIETASTRDGFVSDPVRIMEAIVVGISFLGAGTILKHTREGEGSVEGLTTSASILFVAAIGVAVAINAFVLALGATLLNLFINWVLYYLIGKAKTAAK